MRSHRNPVRMSTSWRMTVPGSDGARASSGIDHWPSWRLTWPPWWVRRRLGHHPRRAQLGHRHRASRTAPHAARHRHWTAPGRARGGARTRQLLPHGGNATSGPRCPPSPTGENTAATSPDSSITDPSPARRPGASRRRRRGHTGGDEGTAGRGASAARRLRELLALDLADLPTTVVSGLAGHRTRARRQLVEAQQALAEACPRGRWVPGTRLRTQRPPAGARAGGGRDPALPVLSRPPFPVADPVPSGDRHHPPPSTESPRNPHTCPPIYSLVYMWTNRWTTPRMTAATGR